jgi:predicted metalloprotease with PDZ domain
MPLGDAPSASLTLHLSDGDAVTTPWTSRDDGAWRLDATTFRWRGFFAVGRLEKHEIAVDGARLDVAVLDRPRAATWPGLEKWITTAARAQTSLYGGFPAPRAQIVVKTSSSREAVPFGETQRGGGHAVVLLIGDEAKDDAFADDWVAVHEFAHLGMPAVESDDAWFSEGFITYYQNVLMGRAGLYDERRMWDEIVAGFGRGKARRRNSTETLAETSAAMSRSHSYMRVYWGGAAIAMLLDVELRRSTNGAKSLDDAMREIHRAFAGRGVEVSAAEILSHLDKWLGRPLFSETARPLLASKEFPAVDEALARFGVVVEHGDVTGFDDAAPDAAIRRAIVGAAAK